MLDFYTDIGVNLFWFQNRSYLTPKFLPNMNDGKELKLTPMVYILTPQFLQCRVIFIVSYKFKRQPTPVNIMPYGGAVQVHYR